MKAEFTQAQNDALEKAYDLLHEHFDCSVMIVTSEVGDSKKEGSRIYWSGGYMNAVGQTDWACHQLNSLETKQSDSEPREPHET